MNGAAISILCQWAWAKVNLENLQKAGDAANIPAAIVEYRRALRHKKRLDALYREHHTALAEEEQRAASTPELPL